MHSLHKNPLIQGKKLTVKALEAKEKDYPCFVSYPDSLVSIDQQAAQKYIASVASIKPKGRKMALVLYLPYTTPNASSLAEVAKNLVEVHNTHLQIRIRLRITPQIAEPPHAVY